MYPEIWTKFCWIWTKPLNYIHVPFSCVSVNWNTCMLCIMDCTESWKSLLIPKNGYEQQYYLSHTYESCLSCVIAMDDWKTVVAIKHNEKQFTWRSNNSVYYHSGKTCRPCLHCIQDTYDIVYQMCCSVNMLGLEDHEKLSNTVIPLLWEQRGTKSHHCKHCTEDSNPKSCKQNTYLI